MTVIMKAEIEKQKTLRGLKNRDIAKAIGKSEQTVKMVMSNCYSGEVLSIERAICKFLDIDYF